MKIRFSIFLIIFFLSANINAAISQSGITGLKQLDSNGIVQLISGNQLTGFISDGPFQGPITHSYYKNGKYETIFDNKIYRGIWKVENKRLCSKKNTASNFNCVYWYTGSKDGGTYAYIIAQGKIFQQFHENVSLDQLDSGSIETETIIEYVTETIVESDNGASIEETAISTGQKKIETIIANGIGTSIQDAAQNAAENALTQAVGSFIDATTLMEKHTVITDGIVSRSKVINKDIKEYSQGSIQFFEILDTKQTSGIFRLTARVDVRIEDFRAYIKELASGTQEVGAGLFAQMKTDQDNTQDRMSLVIDKILMPIIAGEVHDIEIQAPMPLKRFIEICPSIEEEMFFGLFPWNKTSNIPQPCEVAEDGIKERSNVVVIPFSISLKDEFFENMTNIFDNISNSKKELFGNDSINKQQWISGKDDFLVVNNKGAGASSAKFYVLDDFDDESRDYLINKDKQEEGWWRSKRCSSNLIFKILDQNSNVLLSKESRVCADYNSYDVASSLNNKGYAYIPGNKKGEYNRQNLGILSLFIPYKYGSIRQIFAKRNYFLLVRFSPDVLQKAASVEISYVQN